MKRMCRKWICIFLSVIMLCVPLSISATAEERAVYVLSPETGLTETNVAIQEEDLFIPAEVAEYIAEFFVADMFETGQTVWQTEPSVLNVVPMYDERKNYQLFHRTVQRLRGSFSLYRCAQYHIRMG